MRRMILGACDVISLLCTSNGIRQRMTHHAGMLGSYSGPRRPCHCQITGVVDVSSHVQVDWGTVNHSTTFSTSTMPRQSSIPSGGQTILENRGKKVPTTNGERINKKLEELKEYNIGDWTKNNNVANDDPDVQDVCVEAARLVRPLHHEPGIHREDLFTAWTERITTLEVCAPGTSAADPFSKANPNPGQIQDLEDKVHPAQASVGRGTYNGWGLS
jgi:hypothetical protein